MGLPRPGAPGPAAEVPREDEGTSVRSALREPRPCVREPVPARPAPPPRDRELQDGAGQTPQNLGLEPGHSRGL